MTTEPIVQPETTEPKIRIEPTAPAANTRVKLLAALVAAFLLGVVGTATITSRRAPAPIAPQKPSEEKPADANAAKPTLITFSPAAQSTAGIKIETVRLALSGETLSVPGTVEANPNQGAKLTPPAGGKIVQLFAAPGDRVRAGQTLAILDSVDVAAAHAAVRQAQAEARAAAASLNTAQARLAQAQSRQSSALATRQRQRQLAQAGAFSQGPLAAAQSEQAQAQTELTQAQTDAQTRSSAAARAARLFANELVSRAELEQAQADLRQSQARTAQAQARLRLAAQALTRERRIFGDDLLNQQAIQTADADVRAARTEVATTTREVQAARTTVHNAQAAIATAQANLHTLEGNGHLEGGAGRLRMTAPLSGVVTERAATIGEAVERATTLFVIQDLRTVLVQANVPEAQVARVKPGQPARITIAAYPDAHFVGVVQSLGGQVDEKTRTLGVRVRVDNPHGRLKPEMFARVALGTGQPTRSVSVPSSAVDEDGADHFIYVAKNGGFEKRAVTIGRTSETATVIQSGLQPGERIVTEGVFVLKSESKKDELKGDE